ncbi:hypothetical protein K523DRAFT_22380 [Schizophyllum commune Tattone D]|nr:hypothetical protein K523DRAFT_22380 [Schizophyllum commune Tattone D]
MADLVWRVGRRPLGRLAVEGCIRGQRSPLHVAAISSTSATFRAPYTTAADAPGTSCRSPDVSLAFGDQNVLIRDGDIRRGESVPICICYDD